MDRISDKLYTMLPFFWMLLALSIGLFGWDCVNYLKNGTWDSNTLFTFTNFTMQSTWIGVNNIVNWMLQQIPVSILAMIAAFLVLFDALTDKD